MARSSTLAPGSANVLRQTEKAFCPPGPGKPQSIAIGTKLGKGLVQVSLTEQGVSKGNLEKE